MMSFPKHKGSLYLIHNDHKSENMLVEELYDDEDFSEDWVSAEQKAKAIETQEVWSLLWHPGHDELYFHLLGADLEAVMLAATPEMEVWQ